MGEGSYWRRFLSQVLGNELSVAGTWMVVVTRIGVWGGRERNWAWGTPPGSGPTGMGGHGGRRTKPHAACLEENR